jgi:iron complex outermembrane recepter protein
LNKHPTKQQRLLALSAVAQGVALTLAAASTVYAQTPAPAAQAPTTEAERKAKEEAEKVEQAKRLSTIVVRGIRKGIEDAISVKKNADGIVESISAEDIGKLPDSSIAESIARLPGLAAQRVAGRAQTVSIRGLSGDFAGTLLNGREQVSTGDNRAVEFDQFPSELLAGVKVYKTPDASLVGQGLSGTIDMQTVRPLNFSGRQAVVGLRADNNSLGKLNADSKANGTRFNVSYIDQFANRTLGVALGYARLATPSQTQRWEAWGYTGATAPGVPAGTGAAGGGKVFADSNDQTRDGLMAVIQWKPNSRFESVLDLYYSKFDQRTVQRGIEGGFDWGGASLQGAATTPSGYPTPSTIPFGTDDQGRPLNLLTSGTWNSYKPVLRNDAIDRSDSLHAIGWNNKLKVGDGWVVAGDISYSRAKKKESIVETYSGTVPGAAGARGVIGYNQNIGGFPQYTSSINFADPNVIRLVDSGGWNQDGYIKYQNVVDEMTSIKGEVKKDLSGAFSALTFGVNHTTRSKEKAAPEYFLELASSDTRMNGGTFTSRPTALTGLLNPTDLRFSGYGSMVAYNPNALIANGVYRLAPNLNNGDINQKNWIVEEKVTTVYGKLDIDTELGDIPVRGNVGLQAIRTDQSSTGVALAGALATQVTDGKSYTDVLPSLNLAFTLPNDQVARLGIAKSLTRARLDQMRAAFGYGVDTTRTPTQWTGGGGNPKLDPFKALNVDLSYEKYFGTKAYVGAAAFYKELDTYVYQDKVLYNFAGLPTPSGVTAAQRPATNTGLVDAPINGKGGYIHGVELTANLPLAMVTKSLDGFGVQVSYSDTVSKIKVPGLNGLGGQVTGLPGLSRKVANLAFYYEKSGFSARVAQRYRSSYLAEFAGFGADREFVFTNSETVTDLQFGYNFETGVLKGLSLTLQVNNLNNTPYATYFNFQGQQLPKQHQEYGRTVLFGGSYKF